MYSKDTVHTLFKQKTAYEIVVSDWSSDVCSSDLARPPGRSVPLPQSGGLKAALSESPATRGSIGPTLLENGDLAGNSVEGHRSIFADFLLKLTRVHP